MLDTGGPLGTPSSGTATNLTGLPLTTGVTGTLPIANGGTGTTSTTFTNLTTNVTGILPVANGGTATATPSLVQGTGVTISGTWPNQTINATGTGGTVTSASVVTANGFAGTVATATTTPAITLTTSITGVLKGNATAISAAVAGTDYVSPTGTETLTNKTLTSPVLTTPQLGTPSQGVLSSCTVDGTNKVGYLNIPNSGAKTTSYTLVADDVGKFIELGTGGTVVVPASVFAAGDAISIFNNTSASITCTCSAVTDVYKGGTDADISTFGVTTRGVATILFITATRAVVTGNLV
jgi:hypothetical protein